MPSSAAPTLIFPHFVLSFAGIIVRQPPFVDGFRGNFRGAAHDILLSDVVDDAQKEIPRAQDVFVRNPFTLIRPDDLFFFFLSFLFRGINLFSRQFRRIVAAREERDVKATG